mmetsp:Transcript_31301/g.51678  ORF Transcript_31301/g.51678 Transcript_31301/m.51678 type:complete len:80 (-) Transcript_31301:98-337(-)
MVGTAMAATSVALCCDRNSSPLYDIHCESSNRHIINPTTSKHVEKSMPRPSLGGWVFFVVSPPFLREKFSLPVVRTTER